MDDITIDRIITWYQDETRYSKIDLFRQRVERSFSCTPSLNRGVLPIIHSVKTRMKDPDHLRDKLERKWDKFSTAFREAQTSEQCLKCITDLAGVRILHLYLEQFEPLHKFILDQVIEGEWFFVEEPKAFTWDIDTQRFLLKLGLHCEVRDTYYTSVHYVVSPNPSSWITCEIQIRTLFEEIWGEIDHSINYPHQTQSIACKEQLRVLSKLASTGTRLASSIFKSIEEYNTLNH